MADFSSDEEAQKHLATGKGEYNCVITPDTLEKMATDETERAKFEGIIDKAIGELPEIRKQLGNDSENVTKLGISVDSDGNVSYYALIKESLKKNENVEKAKEKAAEKAAVEKYLGINRAPAKKVSAAKKEVKPVVEPCKLDGKSAPCTLTDQKSEVKVTPEKEMVKTELKVVEEIKAEPLQAPAAPQQIKAVEPQPLIPAVSSPF